MNFKVSVYSCFTKFATFKGRASKSEFWWFQSFCLLSALVLVIIFPDIEFDYRKNGSNEPPSFGVIFRLIIFIPQISVAVRRLHDANKSGWWIFFPVFIFSNSTKGENRFGLEPQADNPIQIDTQITAKGISVGDVVFTKINGIKIYAQPNLNADVLLVSSKGDEFIYAGEAIGEFIQVFNSNTKGWIEVITVNKNMQ